MTAGSSGRRWIPRSSRGTTCSPPKGLLIISHLSQRLYSTFWFGALGFLLIPFFAFSYHLTPNQLLASSIISLFFIIIGFFYGYKTLLQPAEQLGPIITRATAAAWCGSIATILTNLAIPTDPTPTKILVCLFSTLIFILLGIFYGYKILELPKISYPKKYPTLRQRVIAMIWFGLMGALIQAFFLHGFTNTNSIFVITATAYLGFAYGWRILLLPDSLKAALKSMMLGFIGSSFMVLIFAVLLALFMVLLPTTGPEIIIINSFVDSLARGLVVGVSVFTLGSLFACIGGIASCLLLYLIGLGFKKTS